MDTIYTEENTKLSLRNQITYGFDETFSKSTIVENHLWLKQFGKTDNIESMSHIDVFSPKVWHDHIKTESKYPITTRTRKYSPGRTAGLLIPMAILTSGLIAVIAIVFTR